MAGGYVGRPNMQPVLGVMITMTTYGTWLRGDARGWVEDGRVRPSDPELEAADRERMKHPPFRFAADQWFEIGAMIGESLMERRQQQILALTVQTWHVHFVLRGSEESIPDLVKCAKESVRYGLRPGRPIWTARYDQRFCNTEQELRNRIAYVERHNLADGRPARPWPFLTPLD